MDKKDVMREIGRIVDSVKTAVLATVAYAEKSPQPDISALYEDVFS